MSDLAAALMVAIRTHANQLDKQGEPYLLHVLRVVEAVSDEARVVAALHDVLEDGPYLGDEEQAKLVDECELDETDFHALIWLTRPAELTYAEYIERIRRATGPSGVIAREVKLADLRDNLGRIPTPVDWSNSGEGSMEVYEPDWTSLRAHYEKAIAVLQ
jgi:hypothetical protein